MRVLNLAVGGTLIPHPNKCYVKVLGIYRLHLCSLKASIQLHLSSSIEPLIFLCGNDIVVM